MAEFNFSPTKTGPGFLGCPRIGEFFTSNTVTVTEVPPDLPLSFTVTGGSLPTGINLVQTGPNTFIFQGTPRVSGNFVIDITATDQSAEQGVGAFAISIPNFGECTLVDQQNLAASQVGNFIGPISLDISSTLLNGGTLFNVPNILVFIGNIAGLQAAINAGLATNANNQVIIDPFSSFINANAFNLTFDFFFRTPDCHDTTLVEDLIIIQSIPDGLFIARAAVVDFQTNGCCDCRPRPKPKPKAALFNYSGIPCICIEPEYFHKRECPDVIRYPDNRKGSIYYKIGINERGWCCYSIYHPAVNGNRIPARACIEIDRYGNIVRKGY